MYLHLVPPSALPELISPLVGEMSGRTEGGNPRNAGVFCQ
jgi:hypothetical protein